VKLATQRSASRNSDDSSRLRGQAGRIARSGAAAVHNARPACQPVQSGPLAIVVSVRRLRLERRAGPRRGHAARNRENRAAGIGRAGSPRCRDAGAGREGLRALKPLERALKRLGLAAASLAAAEPARRPEEVELARLERILVVRQDRRLGNLVLLTSLLGGLRRAAPRATITVVAPAGSPHCSRTSGRRLDPGLDHRRFLGHPARKLWHGGRS